MIAKIAGLAVALMLAGATVALASPPAKDGVDDAAQTTLNQAAASLYVPQSVSPSAFLQDRHAGPRASENLEDNEISGVSLYLPQSMSTSNVLPQNQDRRPF